MDKESARQKIKEIVNNFSSYDIKELNTWKEEQIKFRFIEPLFEALGWEKEDIFKEERVLRGRADYILRSGKKQLLVVEAKKTSVTLDAEQGFQAVSYAHHNKIKFSVVTNFKQIKIYHALSRIKNIEKNLLKDGKGHLWIDFDKFDEQFDRLWLISKESLLNGELDKCLSKKDEKKSVPIDESILIDLFEVRNILSKNLKTLRNYLGDSEIDEIVQIMIDRLIFIRSLEDRGLEEKDLLLNIVKDHKNFITEKRLWGVLKEKFSYFNEQYNSKLFATGLLEEKGFFDETPLIKAIRILYEGSGKDDKARYEFDAIPADILGSIYEQYLGTILSGSDKRVKLLDGKSKRKGMGIYYTPTYIVDYIVSNTVGEYLKEKNIDEILETKIVDPACGSGSFLVRAFDEVCSVAESRLKEGKFSENIPFKNYEGQLTLGQKVKILVSCIHGVDLDEKAVELAQLNLLLKLLEGETTKARKHLLPTMKDNIKCGNSLIEDSGYSDKPFVWEAQFPQVFKNGGFDVVIGNPPYGAELKSDERNYLEAKYGLNNTDTACLFIGLSTKILKDEGLNGFIIPKPFIYSSNWRNVREKVISGITAISDCGKVWKEVKLEQIVYIFRKNEDENTYKSCVRRQEDFECVGRIDKNNFREFGFILNGVSDKELVLGKKIRNSGKFLNDYVSNQRGAIYQKEVSEKPSDFKVIGGKQIGWYYIKTGIKGYINKKNVTDEKAFIKKGSIFVQRLVAHIENPIDHIMITAAMPEDGIASTHIIVDTINQLQNTSGIPSEVLLSIINSKLVSWYAYRFIFGKAIRTMQFDNPVSSRIPIPELENKNCNELTKLVIQMISLQKELHEGNLSGNKKDSLEQQIKNIDYQIDELVFDLYGLTKEEKDIVRSGMPG